MKLIESQNTALIEKGYKIERSDLNRPWGGFWAIANACVPQFIDEYFPSLNQMEMKKGELSPKILFVKKESRLSWQYHLRRSEVWQVIKGTVGVVRSETNEENEMQIFGEGELIVIQREERHRLVGLDEDALVAEMWIHSDASNPSDEDDVVRVQDDFGRNDYRSPKHMAFSLPIASPQRVF